jgi:aryl-alcohol dehydrogenase-like predicted oxidoreductase
MLQFALAWVLREPNVSSAIGTMRVAQIEENIVASGAFVDPTLYAEAELLIRRAV